MARRSPPVETFDIRANVAADFARPPMDDGSLARAAGNLFAAIGGTLSKLVGQAEQKKLAGEVEQATQEGSATASENIGLPVAAPGGDAAGAPQGGDALALIRGFEGFRDKPYWDVNAHRAGYGSDTVTLADGRVAKVTPGMTVSREDAERDLARRSAEFAAGAAKAVGAEAWAALPEAARNGLTSVAYNYGSLPKRVVAAVRSGDVSQIAQAVRGLSGDNGGVNARRRNAEAAVIAGKGVSKGGGGKASPLDVTLPEIRPLQLRTSGTPQDEAYNAALIKTGSFRAKASMQGGLAMLEEKFADDPAGFEKEAAKLQKAYVGAFANVPELSAVADAEFMLNYEPYRRSVYAKRDVAAEKDKRAAASTAVEAQRTSLSKQAYSIGVQADGDVQMAALTKRALNLIDAAFAEGSITQAEVVTQREAALQSIVTSRMDGVFDALKSPAEKQAFADGLRQMWVDGAGPLAQLQPEQFDRLQSRFDTAARKAAVDQDADTRLEKLKFSSLLDDDLASMASTGQGVKVGGLDLSGAEVARVLGEDGALKWQQERAQAARLFQATDGLARLTPGQMEARLAELKPAAGQQDFAARQKLYGAATTAMANVLKRRQEDPAAAADEMSPELRDLRAAFDPANPQTLVPLVKARLAAQQALDIPVIERQPLTKEEAKAIATAMNAAPETAMTWAGVLASEMPDQAERVLAMVSEDAPGLAVAADLIVKGGGSEALRHTANQRQVERDPQYKPPKADAAAELAVAQPLYGPALAALPGRALALRQNAGKIFLSLARERGVEPDVASEEGAALYDRALQISAGASWRDGRQFGGIAEVNGQSTLIPVNMDAGQPQALLQGLTDDMLAQLPPIKSGNGVPVRAKDLRAARLVAVRDGVYRVALGDVLSGNPRYVVSENGFWLLDLRQVQRLAGMFAPRGPKAEAGGAADQVLPGLGGSGALDSPFNDMWGAGGQ